MAPCRRLVLVICLVLPVGGVRAESSGPAVVNSGTLPAGEVVPKPTHQSSNPDQPPVAIDFGTLLPSEIPPLGKRHLGDPTTLPRLGSPAAARPSRRPMPPQKWVAARISAHSADQLKMARQLGLPLAAVDEPRTAEVPADTVMALRQSGLTVGVLQEFVQVRLSPGETEPSDPVGPGSPRGACTQLAFGSWSQDVAIPDDPDTCNAGSRGYDFSSVTLSGYPGETVCNVEYRVRVLHTWPGDLHLQLNNNDHFIFSGDIVWDRLGGTDDGGFDDDVDSDEDIYLNWRSTSFFNGDSVDNTWRLDAWDECPVDTGTIDYIEFRIYYTTAPTVNVSIFNAWWSNAVDGDGDGYASSARLNWDPDVVGCSGSPSVFEKIYFKPASSGSWTLLTTTANHTLNNCSTADSRFVDVASGNHDLYDWRIELYRAGEASPDDTRDSGNDADLNDYAMETAAQDTAVTATIFNAWWSNTVDADSDGHVSAARLNWDPDVAGCAGNPSVFEQIYFKPAASGSWTLLATTPSHVLTDCISGDSQFLDVIGGNHDFYDWRIDITRTGEASPDDSRDPGNDSDLNDYPMETAAEEGGTSFSGTVTDCGSGTGLPGAQVTWGAFATTTNGAGDYSLNDVTCTSDTLTVTRAGFVIHNESYSPACNTSSLKDVCLVSSDIDLAVFTSGVSLSPSGPNVDATVTVNNLGNASAGNVNVQLYKRLSPTNWALADTDQISSIAGGGQDTALLTFSPDGSPQDVKVVASLPVQGDDSDQSNNEAEAVWVAASVAPVVVDVQAEFDGNSGPSVAGRYISGVPLTNAFFATVQEGSAVVTAVSFQMDADPPVAGVLNASGKWSAAFDVGQLAGGQHTLRVIATDATAQDSAPSDLQVDVLDMPSWAEPWNSCFEPEHSAYRLSGFIPEEFRLDQEMPAGWEAIGGQAIRFRAGLFTSTEVGLDNRILHSAVIPGVYASIIGLASVDFTVDGEPIAEDAIHLVDYLAPGGGETYETVLNLYDQLDINFAFDSLSLEVTDLDLNFAVLFEHTVVDVPITPTPIPFVVAGWPMSFEAAVQVTPSIQMDVNVMSDGSNFEFDVPTAVQPNLNLTVLGTVNLVEAAVLAVGVTLQPMIDFTYDIAFVPPSWETAWMIQFVLDLCLQVRLGLGPVNQDLDLGCVTLFTHAWNEGESGGGRSGLPRGVTPPSGVLNRPRLAIRPGGIRALVYSANDLGGDPSEVFAQLGASAGVWDAQVALTDDLYADLDPVVAYTHESDAIVVWTKVKTLAADVPGSTIDELIATQDLYWARRPGSAWSPLAGGVNAVVNAIAEADLGSGTRLFAGGSFTQAGGNAANAVGEWDGASWTEPGGGADCAVVSLAEHDDGSGKSLYAGGCFTTAGGSAAANIARWDGANWSPLANGTNATVRALLDVPSVSAIGPALYAAGDFTQAGGSGANFIARWDGSSWSALGSGVNSPVYTLAEFDDGGGPRLYAAGFFTQAGGQSVANIAAWDGSNWSPVGAGLNSIVNALTVFDDGSGPALYAAGAFTQAGGGSANYIARWDGSTWSPLGGGMDNWVNALTVFDDGSGPALYAGGLFATAGGQGAEYVARWDGANWSPVDIAGVNSFVFALTAFDDGSGEALYLGGDFTQAGGVASSRIVKWKEATWSPPAPLTSDTAADGLARIAFSSVTANGLAMWCRDVASDFDDKAGDEVAFATWDGTSWSSEMLLTDDALGDRDIAVCYQDGSSQALAVWLKETDTVGNRVTLTFAEWNGLSWSVPAAVPGHLEELACQVNVAPLSDGRMLAAWSVQAVDGWRIRAAAFDFSSGWEAVEEVHAGEALVDGLQLQVSDNDDVFLFWHGFGKTDELFGISKAYVNPGAPWVGPTRLTDSPDLEWQPTGAVDSDGSLSLVYARVPGGLGAGRGGSGLPDELGDSILPGDANWTVTPADLSLNGNPWIGETVVIDASLSSSGTSNTVATTARFWIGPPGDPGSVPLGDELTIGGLAPGQTTMIQSAPLVLDMAGMIDVYVDVSPSLAETDLSDNQASLSLNVVSNDATPPQVVGVQFIPLFGVSRLGVELIAEFDEPIASVTASEVVLVGAASGLTVADLIWTESSGTTLHVVYEDGLGEDTFTFTLSAAITDLAGNALDGDGDGTGGDDHAVMFTLLRGDIDLDGDVDLDDATALVEAVLGMPMVPEHDATSDLNGDGEANGGDLQPFTDAILGF